MNINFAAPTSTTGDPDGSPLLDRIVGYVRSAFARIEALGGVPFGYATLDKSALIPTKQLATGTASATTFFRGDRTWATPPGGGGGITQLTGDGTAGPGSGSQALTLASLIAGGSFGSATQVATFTADAKGRITAASNVAISSAVAINQLTGDVAAGPGTGSVSTSIAANAVTNAKLAQAIALTVKGNGTNATANETDIAATAASGAVLRESGSTLGFGTVATAGLAANAVTNAILATMAANTIKMNNTAGVATPTDVTVAAFQTAVTYPGRLRSFQVLTSGTSYTRPAGITSILVECWAGGGGGGGTTSVAASAAVGGGGAAGGYVSRWYLAAPATGTFAIGGAGSAGAATGATGGTGGNTTFTDGTTLITANGGLGGIGEVGLAAVSVVLGGAQPAVSTNGDVNGSGAPGGYATRLSPTVAVSGAGGSSLVGAGGNSLLTQSAGAAGVGHGSGGSGGCTINAGAAVTGGAGTAGIIRVWEFA